MTPSPQQIAFIHACANTSESLTLDSVAGSGKTSTLALGSHKLAGQGRATSFSKPTVTELSRAMSSSFPARTMHGDGLDAIKASLGKVQIDKNNNKIWKFTNDAAKEAELPWQAAQAARQLVDQAQTAGIVPENNKFLLEDIPSNWEALADQYDIEYSPQIQQIARRALLHSNQQVFETKQISFNDMLYIPLFFPMRMKQHKTIIVDEAQDLSPIQHALLRKQLRPGGRIIAAGDEHQCNPPGTKVDTPKGVIPIERLQPGDEVTSYHKDKTRLRARKVLQTQKRHYTGDLFTIEAGLSNYKATPNHRCVARLCADYAHWHIVYLMRQNNKFRIGKTLLRRDKEKEFGLATRLRQEHADSAWLLYAFESKEEALTWEEILSARYSIPQTCFRNSGEVAISQPRLDFTWSQIGDNQDRAMILLEQLGLDLEYPIIQAGVHSEISFERQNLIRACNLQAGIFEVPLEPKQTNGFLSWRKALITKEPYEGPVHSLEIEKVESTNWNGLYFANGILTGNSIYGFRGAMHDSYAELGRNFNAKQLKLTVSFRCPQAVVQEAQKYVPEMEAAPNAPYGDVIEHQHMEITKLPQAILCRNNAPLVKLALRLLLQGITAEVAGKDIGAGLVSLTKRLATGKQSDHMKSLDFYARVERWADREIARSPRKKPTIQDKKTVFEALCLHHDTLGAIRHHLLTLYVNPNDNKRRSARHHLTTIHKSKGREWPEVLFLDPFLLPAKWAVQDWEIQQEKNLSYVGITRAQHILHYCNSDTIN